MNSDDIIREHVIKLLEGGNAHDTFDQAVREFPGDKMNTKFPNGTYSSWFLLEHIVRTQQDIVNFIADSSYKELRWPDDYWPKKNEAATKKKWDQTIKNYHAGLNALIKIVKNKDVNLLEKIPHGTGQTIFREILVVADHTSYHLGEFAIMRQVFGTWYKNH